MSVAVVTVTWKLDDVRVEFVTPSSSTVTLWPAGIDRPENRPHVATSPDTLHDPTEVVGDTLVSNTAELTTVDRSVGASKVTVIWFDPDNVPVDVTNETS